MNPRVVVIWLVAGVACTGTIGGPGRSDPGSPAEADGEGGGPAAEPDPASPELRESLPGDATPPMRRATGLRRLTQREYAATVESLFGVQIDRDNVPRELVRGGHGQIAAAQSTGLDDVRSYLTLASVIAREAIALADLECGATDFACARPWAQSVLERAFRGAAPEEDVARHLAILEAAEAGSLVEARLATLLTAALSSPYFLYRTEIGSEVLRPGYRRLSDFETASRLSYLIWHRPPDEELARLARDGELMRADIRVEQLGRLLGDPRASAGLRAFVFDWMGVRYDDVDQKLAEVRAGTGANLADAVETNLDALIDAELLIPGASFTALLATERAFVDDETAPLLGLEGNRPGEVSLDPRERRGILMQPAVIAAHTKESGASPFTIGHFINESILCDPLSAPPVLPELEDGAASGSTLRERIEAVTSGAPCSSCHARLNPPGFAFLAFDPLGRHVPEDPGGRPWDTSGVMPLGEDEVAFAGAPELAAALATHPSTAGCVARRMFRWAFGRFEADSDLPVVEALQEAAIAEAGEVRALLEALVASEAFTEVRVEEAP